jgi:DnaJ family protein A protein 2
MKFNFSSSGGNSGRNHNNHKKNEDGEEDYYKLLEVNRDASFEEIKKAYRRLSMIHHPDKNGNCEESTIKFKQLANAYETLSDEDKRMMYDMGIRNGNMGGGAMPFDMNINPFDIFNMIFGSQQQQQQQQQQQHFSNLHDFGTFIKFGNGMPMMPMPMPMPMGMGMGIHIIHPEQMEHIHVSDIPGFLRQQQSQQPQQSQQSQQSQQPQQPQQQHSCDKCDIYITLEDAYNGIEKHVVQIGGQELCICIPPGINDKEIIISATATTTSNSRMVHIIVNIKPHELFQRNGLDLILEKEISFKESLCGLEFSIKHVNGKTFHLQHKDGTIIKDGVSKTIQRLGMKDVNGGTGALTIVFKVVYPDKLTKEQIEKLCEIIL